LAHHNYLKPTIGWGTSRVSRIRAAAIAIAVY